MQKKKSAAKAAPKKVVLKTFDTHKPKVRKKITKMFGDAGQVYNPVEALRNYHTKKSKRISVAPAEAELLKHLRLGNNGNVLNILNDLNNSEATKYQLRVEHEGSAKYDMDAEKERLKNLTVLRDVKEFSDTGIKHTQFVQDKMVNKNTFDNPNIKDVDFEPARKNNPPLMLNVIEHLHKLNGDLEKAVIRLSSSASTMLTPEGQLIATPLKTDEPTCRLHSVNNLLFDIQQHVYSLENIAFHLEKIV